MAIRNNKIGGNDWTGGEVLYSQDLNDTFDAVVNGLSNKATARNSYVINLNQGNFPNDYMICVDKFNTAEGDNNTVDITNTTTVFNDSYYRNTLTSTDQTLVCNISIKNSQKIIIYLDYYYSEGDSLFLEISDGTNTTGQINLIPNNYNIIDLFNLDTSLDLVMTFTLNSENYVDGDTWSTKANMPTAREELTSSVVNGKIYVIGGMNTSGDAVSNNEEYNPSTNTWTTKTNISSNRFSLTSSAVNGKIYCIGGYGGTKQENEEYDPNTDTWMTKANMPTARYCLTSSVVNGKIYCIGGYTGTTTEFSYNESYTPNNITLRIYGYSIINYLEN